MEKLFNFSLRPKLALVLIIIFVIMGITGSLIADYVLNASALKIERRLINDNINRAQNIFVEETNQLKIMVNDWSFWDDTADFVNGKNLNYIEKNLYNEAFNNNKWSYFFIFDKNNKFKYAKGYDIVEGKEVAIPPAILTTYFSPDSNLFRNQKRDEAIGGFVIVNNQLQFVASNLIKHSDHSGQYGQLIIMRPLTKESLAVFSKNLELPLKITYLNQKEAKSLMALLKNNAQIIISPQKIEVSILFRDINHQPIAMLSFDMDRSIYKYSVNSITFFLIFLTLTAFISLVALWWFINFIIIRRIDSFNHQITQIAKEKNYSTQIQVVSNDELTRMAEQVNYLLDVIQNSYQILQNRNIELQQLELEKRNIITYAPEPIIITNAEHQITLVNLATETTFECTFIELENQAIDAVFKIHQKNDKGLIEHKKISQLQTDTAESEYQVVYKNKTLPIVLKSALLGGKQRIYILRDVSERKKYETELAKLNQKLILTSRLAGMSDATSMLLHGMENILNSALIKLGKLRDEFSRSKLHNLEKVGKLFKENINNLPIFLAEDEEGKKLPGFIIKLNAQYQKEVKKIMMQLEEINGKINEVRFVAINSHINEKHLVIENIDLIELCNNVIELYAQQIKENNIVINKKYGQFEYVSQDRYKLWSILTNLISNAIDALQSMKQTRIIIISSEKINKKIYIKIADNGVGIPLEERESIIRFNSSISDENEMRLHNSALLAKEIGGSLSVNIDDFTKDTTFILEFPIQLQEEKTKKTSEDRNIFENIE